MLLLSVPCRAMIALCIVVFGVAFANAGEPAAAVKLMVEPGHPWTPPFGLERVGRPLDA